MSHRTFVLRSALIIAVATSTATSTSALTVTRCNTLSDGAFKTALIVESDGTPSIYIVGQDGLTPGIANDPKAAVSWTNARFGGAGAVYADCTGVRGNDEDRLPARGEPEVEDEGGFDEELN